MNLMKWYSVIYILTEHIFSLQLLPRIQKSNLQSQLYNFSHKITKGNIVSVLSFDARFNNKKCEFTTEFEYNEKYKPLCMSRFLKSSIKFDNQTPVISNQKISFDAKKLNDHHFYKMITYFSNQILNIDIIVDKDSDKERVKDDLKDILWNQTNLHLTLYNLDEYYNTKK